MHRFLLSTAVILLTTVNLDGQISDSLRLGNIKASVAFNGGLFRDSQIRGRFVYKPGGKIAVFAGASWITGRDSLGNSRAAIQEYALPSATLANTESDFTPGPVANSYTNAQYAKRYHRVWRVTRAQIETHRRNYNSLSYTMPEVIQNWPAQGDINNGEAALLAPFKDVNNNNQYEPILGEHPIIAGDEAIYVIFNDSNRVNTRFSGKPLGVEVHLMAYAYDRPADTALSNSIFLHYRVVNRSSRDYSNFIYAQWNDFDLGNPVDNSYLSDTIRQMALEYNADPDDDGALGFGSHPPAVGVVDLNGQSKGHMGYYNRLVRDFRFAAPQNAREVELYLNHRWRDSSFLKVEKPNGDGHAPGSSLPRTTWIFGQWSPDSLPSLRAFRSLLNSTPQTLPAGGSLCFDYAYVMARDTNSNNDLFGSVNKIQRQLPRVKQAFAQTYFECSQRTFDLPERAKVRKLGVEVFPNPARHQVRLQFAERQTEVTASLYSVDGRLMKQRSWHKTQGATLHFKLPAGLYVLEVERIRAATTVKC
mgnify:CR=1 FL=1